MQLAEALQARVVDMGGRMNFPKTHYLSAGAAAVANADVIIGMELSDFWGVVNGYVDNGEHGIGHNRTKIKPDTKLISINSVELLTKSNYQDFQRFQSVDVSMPADAEATLPSLIEAVKSAIPNDRKAAIDKRGEAAKKSKAEAQARNRQLAAIAWDASPISTARLSWRLWDAIKDLDWSLVVAVRQRQQLAACGCGRWRSTTIGSAARAATASATASPASVGARARQPRSRRRFSVSIQSRRRSDVRAGRDVDRGAGTRSRCSPVMHNNRGYHQELMHVQRMASFRNRDSNTANDLGPIGTSIMNPDIEYHKLAESMGWWAKGPIKDPAELGPAIKEAMAVVKSGQPALVNVWTQPR